MNPEPIHWSNHIISTILFVADIAIRVGLSARVISRKRAYGVNMAWLIIILLLPFLGAFAYLLFGENRLSENRAARIRQSLGPYQTWLDSLKPACSLNLSTIGPRCRSIIQQATTLINIPAMTGNALEILSTPEDILHSIALDIDNARSSCHLQFYIWCDGGLVDEVTEALIRASARGVKCRLLVDAIGSRSFLKNGAAKKLRQAGVLVRESLPAGILKAQLGRIDIRNHRKIVIIDGSIAYTGSQNMVDPASFKQNEGVGRWIDVMIRITGPIVETLAGTFIYDWFLEGDEAPTPATPPRDIESIRKTAGILPQQPIGTSLVQMVPSGPDNSPEAIHKLLITTLYSAHEELILTTPYFVPDDQILTALKSASERGVDVHIIIPEKNDSKLVQFASQAHFEDLLHAGVTIHLFTGGLLHTKSITVDSKLSLFGSVNLDMRSFWLNFEITLFIYDPETTWTIRELQQSYKQHSRHLSISDLSARPLSIRFRENLALLFGPLL